MQDSRVYNWRKSQIEFTVEEYADLLELQGGRCAICRRWPGKRRLAVDHCHATGTVRGLLCMRCNAGLGLFRDDFEAMQAAADYLIQLDIKQFVLDGL